MEDNKLSATMDMTQTDEQPRIGWIEHHSSGEKTGYNDADAYIDALGEAFELNPNGFAYHTTTKDAAVRMEADRLSYNLFGEPLPYGLDDYGRFSDNGRVKGCLVDMASGEETSFYESDEYVFKLGERLRNAKDKGSVAFFTATKNTAVWKAVDDMIRKEFELADAHAFEHCIRRTPMERAMCVREYVSECLTDSERQWKPGLHDETGKSAGWIRRRDDDERLYFDNADEFIKELKLELALHPENTDFAVTRDEAAIHKAVFDVTGEASGEGNPFYLDELTVEEPDSIKGRVINLSTGGMTEYRKSEDYIEAVKKRLLFTPEQFSFETVTDNSAVWKELDGAVQGRFGVYDKNGIESSLARPKVAGFVTLSGYLNQRIWKETEPKTKEGANNISEEQGRNKDKTVKTSDAKTKTKENMRDMSKAKPAKKRSVLARLAEKQAIVKKRDKKRAMQAERNREGKQTALNAR